MSTDKVSLFPLAVALMLTACSFSGSDPGDLDSPDGDQSDPTDPTDPSDPADSPFDDCAPQHDVSGDLSDDVVCLGPTAVPTAPPLVVIEHAEEDKNGVPAIHVRLTFSPLFNDNTFGTGSVGWEPKAHKFTELVGSDHARVFLLDRDDELVFDLKLDYISAVATAPCGFASLGPFGGDGSVNVGDESLVLDWQTSLDTNLNERGYCMTVDSPQTDGRCTKNSSAPDWDFRVVYDVWVASSAFGTSGFGRGYMESVHASPAKGESTIDVEPHDCPPEGPDGCLDPDGCTEPGPIEG